MEFYTRLTKVKKFIGINVLPFKLTNIIHNDEYSVALKLDGQRHLFLTTDDGVFLITQRMEFKRFQTDLILPKGTSLFDGELYKGKFYIFDTLFYNNVDVRGGTLKDRIEYCKALKAANVAYKPHYIIKDLYKKASELLKTKKYDIDGLIFTPINSVYSKKFPPLKWKKDITIDFKIKVVEYGPTSQEWELYTMNGRVFEPMRRVIVDNVKAMKYTDGTVVEFGWFKDTFQPLRSRSDKKDGNYYGVAVDNYNLILNPIDLKVLKDIRSNSALFNMRQFHNWIKSTLLNIYIGKNTTLLDLASGKGGDLIKWSRMNLKNVVGLEVDSLSIKQAVNRKKKMHVKNVRFYKRDLSKPSAFLPDSKFDNITCFFAIHYFFRNEESILSFFGTVRDNLKTGGYFVGTVFDGGVIDKELEKHYEIVNEDWNIRRVKCNTKSPMNCNAIDVKLNGTVLNVPTKEYLVSIPFMVQTASSFNLEIVKILKFKSFYSLYKPKNLSSSEKKLSFYNIAFVFKKN
jgi:mRNA (guanine-N7-)-methyltransferase